MPTSTFASSPKREPRKKVTYKRFTYPYPEEDKIMRNPPDISLNAEDDAK